MDIREQLGRERGREVIEADVPYRAEADRARSRGDLPDQPAPGTVADIVFGTIWYRMLATHGPLDTSLVDDLLAILTRKPPTAGKP